MITGEDNIIQKFFSDVKPAMDSIQKFDVVEDISKYVEKSAKSIDSEDSEEFEPKQKQLEKQIRDLEKDMCNPYQWRRMTLAFKLLSKPRRRENKYLSQYAITESSLRENFEKLFGFKCDILARVMYIKMSKRKMCAHITFMDFHDTFIRVIDDAKDQRNRAIFDILEFNGDGELDIMILMQIFSNVDRNTCFGQEILKMVREYKCKNVL
jgi:hypothetical protein